MAIATYNNQLRAVIIGESGESNSKQARRLGVPNADNDGRTAPPSDEVKSSTAETVRFA